MNNGLCSSSIHILIDMKCTTQFCWCWIHHYYNAENFQPWGCVPGIGHWKWKPVQCWDDHLLPKGNMTSSVADGTQYPQSPVWTIKCDIQSLNPSTTKEVEQSAVTFLLHYRNATHETTRASPAQKIRSVICDLYPGLCWGRLEVWIWTMGQYTGDTLSKITVMYPTLLLTQRLIQAPHPLDVHNELLCRRPLCLTVPLQSPQSSLELWSVWRLLIN